MRGLRRADSGCGRYPRRSLCGHATLAWWGAHKSALRFTQEELEQQPAWKHFGVEAGKHPPMRGWLAVPLVGEDGRNYGLLQLSDKYNDADFTEEDEAQLTRLAQLAAATLGALLRLHENSTPDHED